jgi:uncharacterized iron-regulated membrane protein
VRALRKVLFWGHFAVGTVAGTLILLLCLSGAVLAFQPQILRFLERSARTISARPRGEALPAGTILRLASEASPGEGPTAATLSADPSEAAAVAFGRERIVYLDPSTGTVIGEGSHAGRAFFAWVQDLHRWLALPEESREAGKTATGAATVAFFALALLGLYIWWPRIRGIRKPSTVGFFQRGLSGKARDFNWHNVVGIWSALPILVITVTGMVLSYRWAGDLVYRIAGSPPPPPQTAGNRGRGRSDAAPPVSAERAAALDRLWSVAEKQSPDWRSITVRLSEKEKAPVAFSIEEGGFLNRFARSALTLDASTGAIVKWEPYGAVNAGRQARSWMRFLHTGEALGLPGQIVAALTCVGGGLLAFTGICLAIRRWASWRARRAVAAKVPGEGLAGMEGVAE